jgi:uncharacterized membrane protein (TIGR02234 family)
MLVIGGAASAAAATQPWVRLQADDGLAVSSAAATGSALAPLSLAAGVVALAAVPALLSLHAWGRRTVATAALLVAAAALVSAVDVALDLQERARSWWSVEVGALADAATATVTAWPAVTVVGLLLIVIGAALVLLRGTDWPGLSGRFESPGTSHRPSASDTGSDVWQALDRGHDPTDDDRSAS